MVQSEVYNLEFNWIVSKREMLLGLVLGLVNNETTCISVQPKIHTSNNDYKYWNHFNHQAQCLHRDLAWWCWCRDLQPSDAVKHTETSRGDKSTSHAEWAKNAGHSLHSRPLPCQIHTQHSIIMCVQAVYFIRGRRRGGAGAGEELLRGFIVHHKGRTVLPWTWTETKDAMICLQKCLRDWGPINSAVPDTAWIENWT